MEVIIIAGHGSPKKDANNVEQIATLLHNMIHPGCSSDCVRVAYLQFAEPDIMQAITDCVKDGAKKIIIHPYFLSSGMHVTTDIPGIIEEARGKYNGVEFVYTEPLGIHNKMAEVVLERISASTGLKPEEIEKRSFEIISEEVDLSDVPEERQSIVKRVIHTTADFEFKGSLVFHPDAVRAGIEAIKSGRDILTDVEMVRTGINKKLLEKWGGKVICNIQESGVRSQESGEKTRAELGIESALKENNNIGIIAIGNAPTALLKTIELLNNSKLQTLNSELLVIGVPVGFVKALESKALLASQQFPFITNLSRKGGSTVAVAIVNALLKMAEGGDDTAQE
ncbi:MAG: precorrin-8X methylmutase [Nitrospirae bacterium]|nr:precorrin-8X methylmutase [Nitrospirota bacterium]